MISRTGILEPRRTRGQLQARLAGLGGGLDGDGGVETRPRHRARGVQVGVGGAQGLPATVGGRGRHLQTAPPLVLVLHPLFLRDNGQVHKG